MKARLLKSVLLVLSSLTMILSVPSQAALIGTNQIMTQQSQLQQSDINSIFERSEVIDKLTALGVDVFVAKQRVANLTDVQIAKINTQFDELPAGGDIVGLAVTVFIVLVITDMLGATDIFPFVKKIN